MYTLRLILVIYVFLGTLVAGGLLFQKKGIQSVFLGIFVLVFSLEILDFLYVTGPLLSEYSEYYMLLFPLCLLFGPMLWFHLNCFSKSKSVSGTEIFVHLIPFGIYSTFTLFLCTMPGTERIRYVDDHFMSLIMPLNYVKALHVTVYGAFMVELVYKSLRRNRDKVNSYCVVLVVIYFVTALLQAYLTLFAENYTSFVFYFLISSSIVLVVGYILYYKPEQLHRIPSKYFTSGLSSQDKARIADKIRTFIREDKNVINTKLNLPVFCGAIEEKKHHVSQTLSEEFRASFNDLINQRRIVLSKRMLSDPDYDHLKILAVAIESGFTNKTTFNRAFAKFEGHTPSQYRKQRVSYN